MRFLDLINRDNTHTLAGLQTEYDKMNAAMAIQRNITGQLIIEKTDEILPEVIEILKHKSVL